uniref:Integrase core domain containing protein n=1 Tax=Solanum tuberosum TaxID=4113 RepID=M1DJX2_SOLTU
MNNQGVLVNPIGGDPCDGVKLHPVRVGDENNKVQGVKQSIDPPMPFGVEVESNQNDYVIEVNRESENVTEKEVEITQKIVPMSRPPPPFPQRLVKKTEEGKYRRFIKSGSEVSIEQRLGVDALAALMMNFDGDGIEDYDELVATLDRFECGTS